MSRPWVNATSFHAISTPSSLRSTTFSFGSTALSLMKTLRLLLFLPRLSPPPPTSLATHSWTSSSWCLAELSSPFNSLPNSLTLQSPYDVIPRIFCFGSTIARWVEMEGDIVLCFVAFGLDLGSWLLLLLLGWHFWEKRERERERGVVGVVTFEIWVLFFEWVWVKERKCVYVGVFFFHSCIWNCVLGFLFYFFISGFVFLNLSLCSCCSCSRHT